MCNGAMIRLLMARAASSSQSTHPTVRQQHTMVLFVFWFKGRVFIPKEKPIETRKEEKVTLDPELEEALASASDTELYDLAG